MDSFFGRLCNILIWSAFLSLLCAIILLILGATAASKRDFYWDYSQDKFLDEDGIYDISRDYIYWEWHESSAAFWVSRAGGGYPEFDDWLRTRAEEQHRRWYWSGGIAAYLLVGWFLLLLVQYLWLGKVVILPFKQRKASKAIASREPDSSVS